MSQLQSIVYRLIKEACNKLFKELIIVRDKFKGSDKGKPVLFIN
jgi:hypothetical protein